MITPVVRAVSVQNKRCWQIKLLVQGRKTEDRAAFRELLKIHISELLDMF